MYDPAMRDILSKLNAVGSAPRSTSNASTTAAAGDEMLDILKRFHLAESGDSKLTPVDVKHGLNKQQKAVGQTPANFKPKTVKVLGSKTDPKNPFDGKLVGGNESYTDNRAILEDNSDRIRQIALDMYEGKIDWTDFLKLVKTDPAAKVLKKAADEMAPDVYADLGSRAGVTEVVEEIINRLWKKFVNDPDLQNDDLTESAVSEDLLSDIKKSLHDYLKQIDDIERTDTDLKKKDKKDTDLKKKSKQDREMFVKRMREDPTQENPVIQPKPAALINPTVADSGAIQTPTVNTDSSQNPQTVGEALKTMECCGKRFEIFGDEQSGFGVRHNGKFAPSRFKTFLEADTALELFGQSVAHSNDYKEEQ